MEVNERKSILTSPKCPGKVEGSIGKSGENNYWKISKQNCKMEILKAAA